jgi:hypothetical protein
MRVLTCALLGLGLVLSAGASAWCDEQADAKAIIEKAVNARGGLDKLAKLKAGTTKTKGKIHARETPIPFTGTNTVQQPDKFRNELNVELMGVPVEIIIVFNGKEGWRAGPQGLQEFSAEQVAEQKHGLHAGQVNNLVVLLKEPGFKLKPLGESKIDGKAVVGVRVSKEGQRDISLFFDTATGLPVRTETLGKDPQQGTDFKAHTTYLDWKEIDGVKHPVKQATYRDGKVYLETEVLDLKTLDKVDPKLFDKPAE